MCRARDAATERKHAAHRLLWACQENFGLKPALRIVIRPAPLDEQWDAFLQKINEGAGQD